MNYEGQIKNQNISINRKNNINKEENEKNSNSNKSIIINTNKGEDNNISLIFSHSEDSEDNNKNKKSSRKSSVFLDKNQENLRKNRDRYKNRKTTIKYKTNFGITIEGVNLDQVDEEKRNILHKACLQIKLSIIKDLVPKLNLEYVNKKDKFGNSPLILACKLPVKTDNNERNQIIKILIKIGADIQCSEPINGWTALHWCCFNGDLLSAKSLIDSGANFFVPNKYGYFPIDLAGEKLNEDLVKYLIDIAIKYLEKIENYELLNEEIIQNNEIYFDQKNSNELINSRKSIKNKELFSQNNSKDENLQKELPIFEKISQTVYLRLYTEHCLYWASFYNYDSKTINKFLNNFYSHPNFPIFCLENRTALHAACIRGSERPFEILLKFYEYKVEM